MVSFTTYQRYVGYVRLQIAGNIDRKEWNTLMDRIEALKERIFELQKKLIETESELFGERLKVKQLSKTYEEPLCDQCGSPWHEIHGAYGEKP